MSADGRNSVAAANGGQASTARFYSNLYLKLHPNWVAIAFCLPIPLSFPSFRRVASLNNYSNSHTLCVSMR
mgnify:CR=1 FL=1